MPVSFIHAADFHLGADLRRFGPAGKRLEAAQFQALEKALDAAVRKTADFVLICGDLFDDRNPSPAVIEETASILGRFKDIPVFIIPGTHDFLSDGSILSSIRSDWVPENVTILNNTCSVPFHIGEHDTFLHFQPNTSNRSTGSPIAGLKKTSDTGIHIGLAHGSLSAPGSPFVSDFPIEPAGVEKSGFHYLALGHWHTPRIEIFGDTVVGYPGIPQPLSFSDPETGSVLFVQIREDSAVSTESIETATVRLKQVSAAICHPQEVKNILDKAADTDTILKLSLQYSDNFNEAFEVEEIIEKSRSRYLLVKENKQDKKQANLPAPVSGEVNEELIRFYRAELERLRDADSSERATIYDKAADLGTRLIKGDL
jgi:DNA repair exonuclease SbcCD nuclease subunit